MDDDRLDKWCWAASAVAVGRYDLPVAQQTVNQRMTVTKVKGSIVNETGSVPEQIRGIEYASHYTKNAASIGSPAVFSGIVTHIDSRRPMTFNMEWENKGGHAIVCAGYRKSDSAVWIIDPWDNISNRFYGLRQLVEGTTIASGTGKYKSTIYLR